MGCYNSDVRGNIPVFNRKDNSSFNSNKMNSSESKVRKDKINCSESKVRKDKINENNELTNNLNKYKLKKFRQLMYEKHLELRENHGCSRSDFEIEEQLNEMAQEYIKKLIDEVNEANDIIFNNYTYENDVLGENIYISDELLKPDEICDKWYSEIKNYKYNDNKKFQKNTSHFTQIVWKSTKKVGFGYESINKRIYVVALYYPAGNIFFQFDNNVPPKIK